MSAYTEKRSEADRHSAKTILVVDDEPSVREVLKRLLKQEGYDVFSAPNGKEALEIIKADPPSMLLLDLMMPEMGGMAVCRRIRENPATRLMPVIMITAKGEVTDEIKGLERGADDYIAKPFDVEEVKARVAGLFRRCEREESAAAPGFMPETISDHTVLIVDDESMVRKIITRVVKKNFPGYQVEEAADLPEAKRKIMDLQPKLVVLDLHMPSGNGMELCRLIQKHPWFSKTRVLILTGYPAPQVRERAFEQGACEFLPKPFEMEELAGSIGRLLA